MLTLVKRCRICGRESLESVLDLGCQYLSGQFVRPTVDRTLFVPQYPLELVRCLGCGLVQLRHTVEPDALFRQYWYRSGVNATMRNHLAEVADFVFCTHNLATRALDVGCNDGTLMRSLEEVSDHKLTVLGIDPSDALPEGAFRGFFPEDLPAEAGDFDLIFSLACFYDVQDPVGFAQAIRKRLRPKGTWVVEVAYLTDILRNHAYDTICHEHLEYYSLSALEEICQRAGMEVWNAFRTDTNGGSLLLEISEAGCRKPTEGLQTLRGEERRTYGPPAQATRLFKHFAIGVEERLDELHNLLKGLFDKGKRIHVYGASTKGNVIIQSANVAQFLECCADRNPLKGGCRTLGTNIPIVSEEVSRRMKPDYYLALPWAFRAEFERRESGSGIPMIFPLPSVSVWLNEESKMAEQKSSEIKSPFVDAVMKKGSTSPSGGKTTGSEAGLPGRTSSGNAMPEVNREQAS